MEAYHCNVQHLFVDHRFLSRKYQLSTTVITLHAANMVSCF